MKLKKQNNAKKYMTLFCGCVMTVVLSSALVINTRENNYDNQKSTETAQVNYAFGNIFTYDEVPKSVALVPELAVNAREQEIKEQKEKEELARIEAEKKAKEEAERIKREQEEAERKRLEEEQARLNAIVYDNMTLAQLSEKLNKSLNSTVADKGELFASYSLEKGVDPYIAVAIMLHETGCKWTCSELVRECNNVGGVKGSPSCGSGAYKAYNSIDEGIKGYIDNLSKGYFSQGLTTPDTIVRKYTGFQNNNWLLKVNNYIEDIKAQ